MTSHQIIDYTETVARDLASTHAGAPLDELRVWVGLAHQREAMVTQLYELSQIEPKLSHFKECEPAAVVRESIMSIWAHEHAHTQFLGRLRSLQSVFSNLTALQGRLEGRVTRSAVAGGIPARLLIAIGKACGAVPEFATQLRSMNLYELLSFHRELETTARMGYARMLELARSLAGADRTSFEAEYGFSFPHDIARILCEEQFHDEAFTVMQCWLTESGDDFLPLDRFECARALHTVCARNLAVDHVLELVGPHAPVARSDAGEPTRWVSAGGFEELFASYGLPVHLV